MPIVSFLFFALLGKSLNVDNTKNRRLLGGKNLVKKNALSIMAIIAILAMQFLVILAYASEPSQPHPANAIWIEPSTVIPPNLTPGTKFNVTVWANCSVKCGGWQIWLVYPKELINATRAGYTAGSKSEFFQNINTIPVDPSFKSHNTTHNRVEYGESWGGTGPFRDPGYGSLCWIEFEIINTNTFNEELGFYGYTGTVRRTFLIDGETGAKVDLNIYPATIIPEYPLQMPLITLIILSLAMTFAFKKFKA